MPETGVVRTRLELEGEREYEAGLRRAQQAAEKTARDAQQAEQRQRRTMGGETGAAPGGPAFEAFQRRLQAAQRSAQNAAVTNRMLAERQQQAQQRAASRTRELNEAFNELGIGGEAIRDKLAAVGTVTDRLGFSFNLSGQKAQQFAAIAGVVAGAAAVVTAAIAATVAVAIEAGRALFELGERGSEAANAFNAFNRLSGVTATTLESLHEATGGRIQDVELMRMSMQALRSGLVGENELAAWFEVATRAAEDMNLNVEQTLGTVTTVLAGGRTTALTELGVNMRAVNDDLRAMGLSAETEEGRIASLRLAMEQLRRDLGDVDNESDLVGDTWEELGVTWDNWVNRLAASFASNERLVEFFAGLNVELENGLPAAEALGTALAELTTDALREAEEIAAQLTPLYEGLVDLSDAIGGIGNALSTVYDVWRFVAGGWINDLMELTTGSRSLADAFSDWSGTADIAGVNLDAVATGEDAVAEAASRAERAQSMWAGTLRELNGELGTTIDREQQLLDTLARATAPEDLEAHPSQRAASPTAGRARWAEEDRQAQRADDAAQRAREQALERETAYQEKLAAEEQLLQERMVREQEAHQQMLTWERETDRQLNENYLREYDRQMALHDQQVENIQAEVEAFNEAERSRGQKNREYFDGIVGSIKKTAGQVQGLFQEIDGAIGAAMDNQLARQLRQAEKMGASAEEQAAMVEANEEKKAKAKGTFLVAYNTVMALTEAAEAIAAFAGSDIPAGIEHTLAAATYTAAAVLAGIQLGGGSSKAAAKPTSTYTAAPEAPSKPSGEDRGMSVYNIYSLGSSQEEMGRAMQLADWERRRGGRPPVGGLGIGYDA